MRKKKNEEEEDVWIMTERHDEEDTGSMKMSVNDF